MMLRAKVGYVITLIVLTVGLSVISTTKVARGSHPPDGNPCTIDLPVVGELYEEIGSIDGTDYKILVPCHWNGKLIAYLHEYVLSGPSVVLPIPAEAELTALGYAIAASAFQVTGTNAIFLGQKDTLDLTKYFKKHTSKPSHTILMGQALGTGMAVNLLQEHNGKYDGVSALEFYSAGLSRISDQFLVVYSV